MEYQTITINGIRVTVPTSIETISLSDCVYEDEDTTLEWNSEPIYGYAKTVPAPDGVGLTLVPCSEEENRAATQAIRDWQNS